MPKFRVDVKAFMSIELEARDVNDARAAANLIAEFGPEFPLGDGAKYIDDDGWCVDGFSEVQALCPTCGENEVEFDEKVCWECDEPEEPPLDTPSLDTSFHDHEMAVD